MENDYNSFNKKLFSELIIKAKGRKTLTQLSDESHISIAHLSRMVNEKLDSPPSPDTIKKLLSKPSNGVTYHDLMRAAGHIEILSSIDNLEFAFNSSEETQSEKEPLPIPETLRKYKSLSMSTVLFALSYSDLTWYITKGANYTKSFSNNFSVELIDEYIGGWTFNIKYLKPTNTENFTKLLTRTVIETWGILALEPVDEKHKVTIVTDEDLVYNAFLQTSPKSLNINISVMLINPEELKVLNEQYVCFSINADKQALKALLIK